MWASGMFITCFNSGPGLGSGREVVTANSSAWREWLKVTTWIQGIWYIYLRKSSPVSLWLVLVVCLNRCWFATLFWKFSSKLILPGQEEDFFLAHGSAPTHRLSEKVGECYIRTEVSSLWSSYWHLLQDRHIILPLWLCRLHWVNIRGDDLMAHKCYYAVRGKDHK